MCCIVGKVSLSFPTSPSIKTLIFRSRHPQLRRLHQQPLLKLWHRAEVLEECHLSPFLVGQQLNQPENQSFHSQKPGGDIDQNILDTLDYLASIPEEQWWQPYSPKEDMD